MHIIDNKDQKRFEYQVDGEIVFIEYILKTSKIFLTHTEVPTKLEGQGIGSKMVNAVLQIVQDRDLTLIPLCPFVTNYIKKHPEWKQLVLR